jgi:signal transduction histidine kinase
MVTNILSQSDRLGHEIDKIISLGRLEASDFSPDLAEVPAKRILARIVVPFQSEALERDIDLSLANEAGNAVLFADGRDLQRALRALVENALKFTPDGGKVVVRCHADDENVVFEVVDDGIGIAPQDQEIIFERFIQLENPLTREHGGSGLGLSFASEIMKAHGTRIEVESELGEGAVFRFRLPRADRQPEKAREAATAFRVATIPTNQRLAK